MLTKTNGLIFVVPIRIPILYVLYKKLFLILKVRRTPVNLILSHNIIIYCTCYIHIIYINPAPDFRTQATGSYHLLCAPGKLQHILYYKNSESNGI